MAFDQSFFSPVGSVSSAAPTIYSYETTDTISQVSAADYFDDKKFQLNVNDLIYVSASDADRYIVYKGEGNPSGGLPLSLSLVKISDDYQVLTSDQYIVSSGGNTITFPLFTNATQPFFIVNEGVSTDTLNGNGSTVPNSTSLTSGQSRGFIPGASDWAEL